jgi:hypothetical protein
VSNCPNCGSSDFVWAGRVRSGLTGAGRLSLRGRGEAEFGTRICRACGHADLFVRDLDLLRSPHRWRPGEFGPVPNEFTPRRAPPSTPAASPSPPPSTPKADPAAPPRPVAPPPPQVVTPPPPPPVEPVLPPVPPTPAPEPILPSEPPLFAESPAPRAEDARPPAPLDPAPEAPAPREEPPAAVAEGVESTPGPTEGRSRKTASKPRTARKPTVRSSGRGSSGG